MKKLSDINPIHAFFLNDENLQDYVFNKKRSEIDLNEQYTIGLVLGCGIYPIMQCRIEEAIDLYHKGILEKLLLTGGVGFLSKNRDESEASVMRRCMLKNGVPDSDIIVEDKSRDTYENMKNSIKNIEECSSSDRLVIVTSDFHSKRAKGMLEKMTALAIYSHGVLDGVHDIDLWNKSKLAAKKLIRMEAALLSWYVKRKIMEDQSVEHVYTKTRI